MIQTKVPMPTEGDVDLDILVTLFSDGDALLKQGDDHVLVRPSGADELLVTLDAHFSDHEGEPVETEDEPAPMDLPWAVRFATKMRLGRGLPLVTVGRFPSNTIAVQYVKMRASFTGFNVNQYEIVDLREETGQ